MRHARVEPHECNDMSPQARPKGEHRSAQHEGTPVSAPAAPASRPAPQTRAAYRHFSSVATRWMDNDAYGHVNNAVYYSYFDTVVNRYLIEAGVLDLERGAVIGLVVETHCNYFSSLAFPQEVHAGLRVAHLGSSSVRYEIGLFGAGETLTAACGHFVHVYVDRATRRPAQLPPALTRALQGLL
jgi:acyl-CoA thioester hydrolase